MHVSVLEFFINNTKAGEFNSKRILEIGSRYVNGSVRPLIEKYSSPKEYIGVDIETGKFVDVILQAGEIADQFGSESFDVVITTELLEHVMDWRDAINNMKTVLKPEGQIYVTTRSKGMEYHGFPYDFWRYESEDIKHIFRDFDIIDSGKDINGVLLKAQKPKKYVPADLSNIALYSMVLGKKTINIPTIKDMPLSRKLTVKLCNSRTRYYLSPFLLNLIKGSSLT